LRKYPVRPWFDIFRSRVLRTREDRRGKSQSGKGKSERPRRDEADRSVETIPSHKALLNRRNNEEKIRPEHGKKKSRAMSKGQRSDRSGLSLTADRLGVIPMSME